MKNIFAIGAFLSGVAFGVIIIGAVTHFVLAVIFGLSISFGQSIGIGVILSLLFNAGSHQ